MDFEAGEDLASKYRKLMGEPEPEDDNGTVFWIGNPDGTVTKKVISE